MAGPSDGNDTGAVIRVSLAMNGSQTSGAIDPVFTPDGANVIFVARGDILPGGTANAEVIVEKNLRTGTLTALTAPSVTIYGLNRPAISRDGTKLAYYGSDANGVDGIFVKDLVTGVVTDVVDENAIRGVVVESGGSESLAFSPDGSKLAFAFLNQTTSHDEIDFANLNTGGISVVYSFDDQLSNTPKFSPDGHEIAFYTLDSTLVPGDTNDGGDLFIKNIDTGVVTRVSTTSSGAQQASGQYEEGRYAFGVRDGRILARRQIHCL